MRIVFLGTPRTAVPALGALIDAGHEVPLVITQPDRPVGRSRSPQPPPVKRAAVERGIEVAQPRRVRNAAFLSLIRDRAPDLLAVVAYGRILTPPALEVAPLGAVNVHFSLLPRYRGAAPVQWALANGERTTGVTTMQMNEQLDEGDLLLQREVAIEPIEHAPALQARLAGIGAELLAETVARLGPGEIEARPQDHALATLAPLLSRADGEIELRLAAAEVAGRVRGFDPWPGVWVGRRGGRIRLLRVREIEDFARDVPPGTVVDLPGRRLALVCGTGTGVELLRIQPEGRRPLTAAEAINGRQLQAGDRLSSLRTSSSSS